MYRILSFLTICFLFACTSEKQRQESVLALKQLQQIPIMELSVSKIIQPKQQAYFINIETTVQASLDLNQLSANDIESNGEKIRLVLPKPLISPIKLQPNNLHLVYPKDNNGIPWNEQQEKMVLSQAEQELYQKLESIQIRSEAETKTTAFISVYLKAIGYSSIHIRFKDVQ